MNFRILNLKDEMLNERIEEFRVTLKSYKKMVAILPTPCLGRSFSSTSSVATVSTHQSRSIMIQTHSQFIKIDSPEVYEYFSQYGKVVNVRQIPPKRSSGYQFGFLKFKEFESAKNALGK